MKKSRLIFFAVLIIAVISLSIFVLLKNDNSNNVGIMSQPSEFKGNSEKLVDFGENVIRYGKDVYFIDEIMNLLLKFDPENNISTIIHNFEKSDYGKRFFIRNNKIIYSFNNNTYYSDLDGSNMTKMCIGEIVYINDDIYLYIFHNASSDELYIVSYDNKTFKQTSNVNKNLAKGTSIKYLKSSDEEVFFTSDNSENMISLFEVDIKNSKVSIIDKRSTNASSEGHKAEYSNVIKTEDSYYYIVSEIASTTNEDIYVSSSLYEASKDYFNSELYADNVGRYLSYNMKNKNEIFFQRYDDQKKKFTWRKNSVKDEVNSSWESFLYGDVTGLFRLNGTSIYEDDYELVNLEKNLTGYRIYKAIRLKNGIYFMIENDDSSEWYFCKENGNSLLKLY